MVSAVTLPISGSSIGMKFRMMKARANTVMAIYITRFTSAICVLAVTVPMSAPTSMGVSVPESEFSVPPIILSWLPRLPPPPSRLSMGLTTVLRIQTEKPEMNAPSRYTQNPGIPPEKPERYWISTPKKPTAIPMRAVFL